ncbi:MAG: LCP family protein [Levilactobacillus sp.]|uniref:LytR family transcriptional regulator n=1 Tax=Levilactobacillus suantsaiihabitans TaxID=2487722 RepID=A0A4Z0JAJ0_9LACO|nr:MULTISPECIES: LCP family protein [Levilactobacillus]MCI1553373.1 LCP family protein [Levilactobacillus sp.]MCI1599092.1 LCP family protein [Levilactobacillus sp.]MCI1606585.1 LCP family protein [Levilactobacillus sp.]TGD19786.1 LytR family transcriptional regulator [Levilactobacillus suantsaiihabitans]
MQNTPLPPRRPEFTPRRHRGWRLLFILLGGLLLIGGVWGWRAWHSAQQTFSQTYHAVGRPSDTTITSGKPFAILLLGTDTGALGRHQVGRTDTMIVATIDPQKQTATLTSIPRDTLVDIYGSQQDDEKINAAYPLYGASATLKTVEHLVNVPIHYYVLLNMGGLEKMINAVGGVTVDPLLTFHYEQANVTKGTKIHLNGASALAYSRMRDQDPLGDYGRQARQRQIIKALVLKEASLSSLVRYQTVLKSLTHNLQTNLTFDDLMWLRTKDGHTSRHIKSATLQGQPATINGIDYQIVPQSEITAVSNQLRQDLGLAPATSFVTDALEPTGF